MDICEEKLIENMKQGSDQAFERCYKLTSSQIYTVIYKVCLNEASAKELLQDTYLSIFEQIKTYNPKKCPFLPWAKKIAFNKTLNFIKRQNRLELVSELPETQVQGDILFNELSNNELIESVFSKVTAIERLILWLFIVEQYSHEEIAQLSGKTESYSKSILSRVLKRIHLSQEVKDYAFNK